MPLHQKLIKPMLVNSLLLSSSILYSNVNASLLSNSTLKFDAGVYVCLISGTFPNCMHGLTHVVSGSYMGFDTNGSQTVDLPERAALEEVQGINLGVIQSIGKIDKQYEHITGFGQHFSNSAINILSDDGSGNVTLDLSGWNMQWMYKSDSSAAFWGIENYSLGGGHPSYPDETGIATVTCDLDCSIGDRFILDYSVHTLPIEGDGNGLNNTQYELHLEGTISAVPLPAAVWLFGSGLVGLIGVARRKKS